MYKNTARYSKGCNIFSFGNFVVLKAKDIIKSSSDMRNRKFIKLITIPYNHTHEEIRDGFAKSAWYYELKINWKKTAH
jgi:hypothetical protein